MLQKCAILGLLLLAAGGSALAWAYHEARIEWTQVEDCNLADPLKPEDYLAKYGGWYRLNPDEQNQLLLEIEKEREDKTPAQLDREQVARLRADMDKLAAGEMHGGDIADFLYGRGWEIQVELHKKHKEQMEITRTISTVCLAIGGVLFGGCFGFWMLLLIARGIRAMRSRAPRRAIVEDPEPPVPELTDIPPGEEEVPPVAETPEIPEVPEISPTTENPEERPRQRRRVLPRSEVSGGSGASGPATAMLTADGFLDSLPATRDAGPSWATRHEIEDEGVAVLLTDEQSSQQDWSPEAQWSFSGATTAPPEPSVPTQPFVRQPAVSVPDQKENTVAVENTLKDQAEDLHKQIAEFKQMAQDVQHASREPGPLGDTLKELTQQVSAIREYAASQQDRVEKLQDGYDWGIIRTFCLRVIRCIDNVENRLADAEGDPARHLEEIRDELLFALESSGVEQFRPEANSDYRGQEKLAEATKQREPAKKPEQAGRIARVIRPGYRYIVDDDNFKVVRTAQVQLFG